MNINGRRSCKTSVNFSLTKRIVINGCVSSKIVQRVHKINVFSCGASCTINF